MANEQVSSVMTPVRHADNTYDTFIEDWKKIKVPTSPSAKARYPNLFDDYFAMMLEEFINTDSKYQEFGPADKMACIGTLLALQADRIDRLNSDQNYKWGIQAFCERFSQGMTVKAFLVEAVSLNFAAADDRFYRYDHPVWVPCEESEVRLYKVEEKFNFNSEFKTYGLESSDVENGYQWIRSLYRELNDEISTFNDDLNPLLEKIKQNPVKMDTAPFLLPCQTRTIRIAKTSMRLPLPRDHFTVRLPYDINQESSAVTVRFLEAFACKKRALADAIIRWGCRGEPTLTLLIGPENSGKITLSRYVQSLYGPFACEGSLTDEVSAIDRTCFIEDLDDLAVNPDAVRAHPCANLVCLLNQDLPSLGEEFGGRKVHRLRLTRAIEPEVRRSDILETVTISEELGCGLGWCITHFNPMVYRPSVPSLGQLMHFLQMLTR